MKMLSRLLTLLCAGPALALAVYAPVPEQEQGKALSFKLGASVIHDSNIFGSATGEIDSMVYSVAPSVAFNASLTAQTFLSLGYDLTVDHFVDRPSEKRLTSHAFNARLAHQFNKDTVLDVSDSYTIAKNPQSLLSGVPLNTDQSSKSNQFNFRLDAPLGQKISTVVKYRNLDLVFDQANLAALLDRNENLAGLELAYAVLPETKIVGEYRYQTVSYDVGGSGKDKRSHYFMAGADRKIGKELTVSARAGLEKRDRDSGANTTAPYAEVSTRYAYTEGSYIAAGYSYLLEEASDTANYTDTQVNRLFVNLQHKLSALIVASGSLTWEPSQLQGRRGVHADIDETTTRFGLGLSWLPGKNWLIGATFDLDRVTSDDANRAQDRIRYGVNARLNF